MKLNSNYNNLKENYLFATVGKKASAYMEAHPDKRVIKLGIGDVTEPLVPAVVKALHEGADEMAKKETFKGYGPYEGYAFVREAISNYYKTFSVSVSADEIFVSDGAKNDIANILDIFSEDNTVLVPDPVYPVYLDTNIMAGRKVIFSDATEENGFCPVPDKNVHADIIYICSPNNPTGAVYTKEKLKLWVDYANAHGSIILFDAAYEAFVSEPNLPRSIFEIEGARTCAIELCSLSKTAGFTGTRCGYTVISKELVREGKKLSDVWLRRQSTKHNGVPYIIQKGAAAVFSEQGLKEIREVIEIYRKNASVMAKAFDEMGISYTGGINSPYIWLKCPNNMKSWDFFDFLLEKANVVGTPGAGFGENGEGFFRLTAFNTLENTVEAMNRIKAVIK